MFYKTKKFGGDWSTIWSTGGSFFFYTVPSSALSIFEGISDFEGFRRFSIVPKSLSQVGTLFFSSYKFYDIT